jgi:hypothetical protein
VTFVPYAEFVARRDRRLRVIAELRSEARAQTIEGEVLEVDAGERPTSAKGKSREGSEAIDGCGTDQEDEPWHLALVPVVDQLSLPRPEWGGPDLDDQDLIRTHDPVLDAAHHHFSSGIEREHNGVAGLDS